MFNAMSKMFFMHQDKSKLPKTYVSVKNLFLLLIFQCKLLAKS